MPVKVRCRGCQKVLNAPDKARGRVVQCPGCGARIKVPDGDAPPTKKSGSKKSAPKEPSASDSSEFLAGLGVNHLEAEDSEAKVCPYCAADMEAEQTICRKCGMNTVTGQMDSKEAKKRARKGPDPALFYSKAWNDSWEFLSQYWRLGLRTSLIWTVFLTGLITCMFLAKTWVFDPAAHAPEQPAVHVEGEEAAGPTNPMMSPGFFFWVGMAGVMFLGIPGWYWSLSLKIIDKTMTREELKEDRIQYDMFESIALGFRLFFWPFVLMMPVGPIYIVLAFVFGLLAAITAMQTGAPPSTGLIVMLASFFVGPYLFFPQAMVHMSVRHRYKAWILWDQIVIFFKNAGATLYWWLVAVVVFLPAIVILTLLGLNLESAFQWTYSKLDEVAAWMFAFIMDVGEPGDRGLFYSILFTLFLPVGVGVIAAPFAFLCGFPAVFLMRATGLYGFYRRETLDLVTHISANTPAGIWVRYLCYIIDATVLQAFQLLTFGIPFVLVASEFPLARYFGGATIPAVNLGLVAIAGSRNKRAAGFSLGLGGLAGVTFIYGETIEFFQHVFTAIYYILPLYNAWMYFAVNQASTQRSTIGKEAFGLIVQTAEKQKEITLGQATGRFFVKMLSGLLLGLPYLVCLFNPKKQMGHDIVAKTEVVFRGDK
ncbi:MAG: RDD family protein [Planctomycetaceae bacterium]|nr:RDD family protein [Planctomycetaceae bacterium]